MRMFFAGKAVSAGIVLILLTTGISGPRRTSIVSGTQLSQEVPELGHSNDVKKMQEALRDKGHFPGEVDGVFGLRTRAHIRAYQKTENLPVTGQLDIQTAAKLGVRPESRAETGYETAKDKPPAGIRRAEGSVRTRRTLAKSVSEPTRTVPP